MNLVNDNNGEALEIKKLTARRGGGALGLALGGLIAYACLALYVALAS